MTLGRFAAWLAGLWAGLLLGIALIGVPAGFALLASIDAGRVAGRMFAQEAYLSLGLAIVLFLIERARARRTVEAGTGSLLNADMLLLLGTLFCTIAGYFALLPMMAAARAGQGAWSFGALHAASAAFYGLKVLFVGALAWRLTRRAAEPLTQVPTS